MDALQGLQKCLIIIMDHIHPQFVHPSQALNLIKQSKPSEKKGQQNGQN